MLLKIELRVTLDMSPALAIRHNNWVSVIWFLDMFFHRLFPCCYKITFYRKVNTCSILVKPNLSINNLSKPKATPEQSGSPDSNAAIKF